MSDTVKKKNLMTHLVVGYPSIEANIETIKAMQDAGVDYIELQIPFSDPIADGKTILSANQAALINCCSCLHRVGADDPIAVPGVPIFCQSCH